MPFYFPDTPALPLPEGHRFPAAKYQLLHDASVRERLFDGIGLAPAPAAAMHELALAHDEAYIREVLDGTLAAEAQRRIGIPWSGALRDRSLATVGGALAAARDALDDGIAGQLAGGTHHAHRGFGSGYCVFNDLAVTALKLLADGRVTRVSILDCDVHQGDGTAAILSGVGAVQTISIHGAKNFPFRKVASDLDIDLPDGTGDAAYLTALDRALDAVADFSPDILLYLSGADVLAEDRLGRLSLSLPGLEARDLAVFRFAAARALPVSMAIGGGYAEPIEHSVAGYLATLRAARDVYGF